MTQPSKMATANLVSSDQGGPLLTYLLGVFPGFVLLPSASARPEGRSTLPARCPAWDGTFGSARRYPRPHTPGVGGRSYMMIRCRSKQRCGRDGHTDGPQMAQQCLGSTRIAPPASRAIGLVPPFVRRSVLDWIFEVAFEVVVRGRPIPVLVRIENYEPHKYFCRSAGIAAFHDRAGTRTNADPFLLDGCAPRWFLTAIRL